jgi:hypothetical protein
MQPWMIVTLKRLTAKAQGTLKAFKTLCAALRSLRLCGENFEAL